MLLKQNVKAVKENVGLWERLGGVGREEHRDRHKQTQRVGGNAVIQDGWPGCQEAAKDKVVRTASPDQRPTSLTKGDD